MEAWFMNNMFSHKVIVNTAKADNVKWDRNIGIFADGMLRVDEPEGATDFEGVPGENIQEHFVCTVPRELHRYMQL